MSTPTSTAFVLRPVRPATDAPLLQRWLTHPRSAYWLMTDASLVDVEDMLRAVDRTDGRAAYVGSLRAGEQDDEPTFLVETYDPARFEVSEVHTAEPGDIGMHVLVAPTDTPRHGFTLAVFHAVMDLLFADPDTHRVVVEPDARNERVHRLNAAVGFRVERRVALPGKEALLSTCTRERYLETRRDPA